MTPIDSTFSLKILQLNVSYFRVLFARLFVSIAVEMKRYMRRVVCKTKAINENYFPEINGFMLIVT